MLSTIIQKNQPVWKNSTFLDFWSVSFIDCGYKKEYIPALLSVEIGLLECPSNVFAESMGRISGLQRTKLRNKM